MRKATVGAIMVLALLDTVLLTGCAATETRTDTFSVGLEPSVEVTVGNGKVSLVVGSDGEITVTADLKNPDSIEYRISQEGDTVALDAKTRGGSRADVTVTAPENTVFELASGNGDVAVTGMQASGRVSSGNGSIVLKQVRSDVTASAGDGNISSSDVEGDCILSVGNGDIELVRATGSFILSTGNGDVRLTEASGSVALSAGNGSILFKGELVPGSDNTVSTGNGPVNMEIAGPLSVSLDLEIDDRGKIDVDLPVVVSEQSEYHLIGTVGDGDAALKVRTDCGNITIK